MTPRLETRATGRPVTRGAVRRPAQGAARMTAPVTGRAARRRTRPHAFGTVLSPTVARFRVRLEAIGLGRWVSLFTGAREAGPAPTGWRGAS